jgi:predicted ABC-type transport system involved in lysophospholipase L1 biosynthesis ATPase subunit
METLLATVRGAGFSALIASLAGYTAPHAGEVSTVADALGAAGQPERA